MIIDFSNPWAFIVWYFVTAGLLYASYKTKKSKLCLIPVIYFMIILIVSSSNSEAIIDIVMHRVFNFLGLAAALSMFIAMDEVETRRKFISQVFKNRYKKAKLPSDMTEEERKEEGIDNLELNDIEIDDSGE